MVRVQCAELRCPRLEENTFWRDIIFQFYTIGRHPLGQKSLRPGANRWNEIFGYWRKPQDVLLGAQPHNIILYYYNIHTWGISIYCYYIIFDTVAAPAATTGDSSAPIMTCILTASGVARSSSSRSYYTWEEREEKRVVKPIYDLAAATATPDNGVVCSRPEKRLIHDFSRSDGFSE